MVQVKLQAVLRAYHEASDACVLGDMEACERMGNLQHQDGSCSMAGHLKPK